MTPDATSRPRVAVFGSFLGGVALLTELSGALASEVILAGVATDDPQAAWCNARRRLWRYPHSRADELIVPEFSVKLGLQAFSGRIRSPEFQSLFFEHWRPDLCLMATFGQIIPEPLFRFPRLGFVNFHHGGDTWPSYPGPDPISAMHLDGRKEVFLNLHEVTGVVDGGRLVAQSHPVPLFPADTPIDLHRRSWPTMGAFVRREVFRLLRRLQRHRATGHAGGIDGRRFALTSLLYGRL